MFLSRRHFANRPLSPSLSSLRELYFQDTKRIPDDTFRFLLFPRAKTFDRPLKKRMFEKRCTRPWIAGAYERRRASRITSRSRYRATSSRILSGSSLIGERLYESPDAISQKPLPSRTDDERSLNLSSEGDSGDPGKTSRGLNARKALRRCRGTVAFNLLSPRPFRTCILYRARVYSRQL